MKGPEAGGKDLSSKIDSFKLMIDEAKKEYPDVKVFATTLRQVISANEHLWGAIMLAEDQWYVEEPRPIQVLDRIGGGDAFSALFRAAESGEDKTNTRENQPCRKCTKGSNSFAKRTIFYLRHINH